MSFYWGLPALYSMGASCALCCLKFPARFSKPLTERPGPRRDWPRGFRDMSIVSAGSQSLTKGEKEAASLPCWLRGPRGVVFTANPGRPRAFSGVGTWSTENPGRVGRGPGIRPGRRILPPAHRGLGQEIPHLSEPVSPSIK